MAVKPRECRARVLGIRAPAAAVIEVDLGMEDPPRLEFEAGQWVSIPFGPKVVRAYTIASAPASADVITLAADVEPGGLGSTWFRHLTPGTVVRFKGPLGGFVFDRSETRQVLFVAEEIGIVPIRSILVDLDRAGLHPRARLAYGAREPAGLVYDLEFRARAAADAAFTYHPSVGAAGPGWTGERGALGELVDRLTPSTDDLVVYVAGGERTIHEVRDRLVAKGLPRKAVKWEKFW
jgi:CDP-4-dehydro-6-deoxyglucose reductase